MINVKQLLARIQILCTVSDMWILMYAVVVVMVFGSDVLALRPLNPEAAQRVEVQSIATPPTLTSPSIRAADCADHLMAGATTSGVYEIFPFTCKCGKPMLVWCDMETDGGGWTVMLNRQVQTQQLDFNRTWEEYKEGFGNPHSEYYLGNELLHRLTSSRLYAIRLDMELTSGRQEYATYEQFRVNPEKNRYSTYVLGSRAGSWSSCFSYLGGRSFTTFDRDYDSYSNGNCAAEKGGGWWYNNCRYFNPTSPYNTTISLTCSGSPLSVTKLQLKLRPFVCDITFKTIHLTEMSCGCQDPAH